MSDELLFKERASVHDRFVEGMVDLLRRDDMIAYVARSGVEFGPLAGIMEELRRSSEPIARRSRFNPDGMLAFSKSVPRVGKMVHLDGKASRYIEREPYELYMHKEEIGEPVLLFIAPGLTAFGKDCKVYVCRVRSLVLIPGEVTVGEHPPYERFPVRDHWVCPRLSPSGTKKGSGTDYREIDFGKSGVLLVARARRVRPDTIELQPDFLSGDSAFRAAGQRSTDVVQKLWKPYHDALKWLLSIDKGSGIGGRAEVERAMSELRKLLSESMNGR